jgi:hypothetical protein
MVKEIFCKLEHLTSQEIGKQLREYSRKGFSWQKERDSCTISTNSNTFYQADIIKKLEETKLITGNKFQLELIAAKYICELLHHKMCPANCYNSCNLHSRSHYS